MIYVKIPEEEFERYYAADSKIQILHNGLYLSKIKVFNKKVLETFCHPEFTYVIGYKLLDTPMSHYNHRKLNKASFYLAKEYMFMCLLIKPT